MVSAGRSGRTAGFYLWGLEEEGLPWAREVE